MTPPPGPQHTRRTPILGISLHIYDASDSHRLKPQIFVWPPGRALDLHRWICRHTEVDLAGGESPSDRSSALRLFTTFTSARLAS